MVRIGFHARGMDELKRVVGVEGVDIVELKPDKFRQKGEDLYIYNPSKGSFILDNYRIAEINDLCGEKAINVQIHLPFEDRHDRNIETGLCYADREHHEALLARFAMFGELNKYSGMATVLTTHPPAFRVDGKEWDEDEAMDAGVEFFVKLDGLIKREGYRYDVGIENIVMPKIAGTAHFGYIPEQIDKIIGYTSEIGITIDTGHRRLNDEMSIAKLASYARIVNMHLHSNAGEVRSMDYQDDEHILATKNNLPHFNRYLKTIRRRKMPIVLEIDKISDYSNEELARYVRGLKVMVHKP